MEVLKPENTGGSWGLNDYVVKDIIKRMIPSYIVDFGCGMGKYGLICKEVLNYKYHIIGVDGFSPTINWLKTQEIYDELFCIDIQDDLFTGDLAIFGDCLEHLEFKFAMDTLRRAVKNFKFVIVIIPLGEVEQGICGDNILENHLCSFKEEDFNEFNIIEKHLAVGKTETGKMTKLAILIQK